ncbi:hypothetical protein ACFL6U_03220 [Planctomycetota bacterium]
MVLQWSHLALTSTRGFISQIGLADELSDMERLDRYKTAMNMAANVNEKRMALSGIGELKTREAMQIAQDLFL